MSPTPPKPPRRPKTPKSPLAEPSALERRIAADRTTVAPAELRVQLDAEAPTPEALKALGVTDDRLGKLAAYLAGAAPKLAERAAGDRAFAEALHLDPEAALRELGAPDDLVAAIDVKTRGELLARFAGVVLDPGTLHRATDWGDASPATRSAIALLGATFDDAGTDPARLGALRTNPYPAVTAAATAHPVAGVTAGSAAEASVVQQVGDALLAAVGRDPSSIFRLDLSGLVDAGPVRIPTPRGL